MILKKYPNFIFNNERYQIFTVIYNKNIKAGNMSADLNSDYSTLSLRILANNGYLYRGSRMSDNMTLNIPFGEE